MEIAKFARALILATDHHGAFGLASGDVGLILKSVRLMADQTIPEAILFVELRTERGATAAFALGEAGLPFTHSVHPDGYPLADYPPLGIVVLVRMDGSQGRSLSVEWFRNGRRVGCTPDNPSIVNHSDGRTEVRYWAADIDITESVRNPVARLEDAGRWPSPFNRVLLAPSRMLALVAEAEADGFAVLLRRYYEGSHVAYSAGDGAPYHLMDYRDYVELGHRPENLLEMVWSSKHASKAVRSVGGRLHGPTLRAPALLYVDRRKTLVEYFDMGRRVEPEGGEPELGVGPVP